MNTVYLSLGSNEGDRMQWLQKALMLLGDLDGKIVKVSSVSETAAWGITDQPDFLNMAIEYETEETAAELLAGINDIESQLGRQRDVKWGPRTLDIDILLFNDEVINTPDLIIPHPYLQERLFTLMPLAELAPDYIHPILHKSISDLLAACSTDLIVKKYIGY